MARLAEDLAAKRRIFGVYLPLAEQQQRRMTIATEARVFGLFPAFSGGLSGDSVSAHIVNFLPSSKLCCLKSVKVANF